MSKQMLLLTTSHSCSQIFQKQYCQLKDFWTTFSKLAKKLNSRMAFKALRLNIYFFKIKLIFEGC